jgi:hypothetical protein
MKRSNFAIYIGIAIMAFVLLMKEDRVGDLPLKFHPVAIRASAVDTPFGAD